MTRLSITGGLVALMLAATPVAAQTPPQGLLPQGEGRDLVAVACSQCHALNVIASVREGASGWTRHVHNMVLRGAQLSPRETDTVIKYLSNNLGPGAGPMGSPIQITLPNGDGKDLVEARCSSCHSLERVTIVKRPGREWAGVVTNMVGRGAAATPDEAKAMIAYLTAKFGGD